MIVDAATPLAGDESRMFPVDANVRFSAELEPTRKKPESAEINVLPFKLPVGEVLNVKELKFNESVLAPLPSTAEPKLTKPPVTFKLKLTLICAVAESVILPSPPSAFKVRLLT